MKTGTKIEKHGMCYTPEYVVWAHIKVRCYNPNDKRYHRYGGRGITICDRWKNSFIAFYKDMGSKPFPKAQLDRKENDKGYYKDNCRWVTNTINCQNKSNIKLSIKKAREIRKLYFKNGKTQLEISKIYNVTFSTISHIVNNKTWKEPKQSGDEE